MNFAQVKQVVIPEGNVKRIDINGVKHWPNFIEKIIRGVSPLSLPNTTNNPIEQLIQYGLCGQNGTPTPANPIDIKCNNGIIRVKDRELPYGYRRLLDINFDGGFYYNTEEKLTGDDDVTLRLKNTSSSGQNVFGCYSGTAAGRKNFSFYIYGNGSSNNSYLRYGEHLYRPNFGSDERTVTFGKNGTTGFETNVNITPEEFETTSAAYIGMLPNSSSPEYTGTIVGNILVSNRLKWIPCKRMSDNVIGYYEVYTKAFIEKTGDGVPTTSGYDNNYYDELFIDGTPEILSIDSQTANVENLFGVEDYKDEQDIISGQITRRVGIKILNGTEDFIMFSDNYIKSDATNICLIKQDCLSIVSDDVICTHLTSIRYAIWQTVGYPNTITLNLNHQIHFNIDNTLTGVNYGVDDRTTVLAKVKAWMAAQYEAGTPLIVIYPLATETTEQVTPQPLNTTEPSNIVTVNSDLNNIELFVKYKASE